MSDFSDLINVYKKRSHISAKELGEGTGIGTNIYKYVRGSRLPSEPGVVDLISDYMNMSNEDRHKLRDYWRIEHFGKERISLWREIETMLQHFRLVPDEAQSYLFEQKLPDSLLKQPISYLRGDLNIQQVLLAVLTATGDGPVHAVVQPDDPHILECLSIAEKSANQREIRNIIRMKQRGGHYADVMRKNLAILQSTLTLALGSDRYTSYYYYTDDTAQEKWPLMSSYVVTDSCALIFGNGTTAMTGIFTKDPTLVTDLNVHFDSLLKESRLMVSRPETPSRIIEDYHAYYTLAEKTSPRMRGIVIGAQPCLTPFLTKELCGRYMRSDNRELRPLVEPYLSYLSWWRNHIRGMMNDIVSVDGIRQFLDTGRIDEIPEAYYTPLSKDDRLQVVRNWLVNSSPDNVHFLKEGSSLVRSGLTLTSSPAFFSVSLVHENKFYTFFSKEPSTTACFWDYFSNLDDRIYMSFDEGKQKIQNIIDQLR
ncbi:MAG: hypothetical protein ACOYBD_11260 [Bilifractor sp.]|jgi:hypothetical protein